MKKQLLILILLLVVFVGCKSVKETVKTTEKIEVKTAHIVSFSDTIIQVQSEASSLFVPISILKFKDSLNNVPKVFKQQNGRSKVTLTIFKDSLIATSECDSIALRAQIKKEFIKDYTNKTHKAERIKVVKSGYNLLQVILYSLAAFSIGAVATFILKTTKII